MATTPPSGAAGADATDAAVATDPAAPKPAPSRRSRRLRKILVNVLAVLTCVATLVSVIAVWTHQTVFDTDNWMEIVGPLADDPAITDAVGTRISEQLFSVIDAQQLATDALPDKAAFLAAPLTNAIQGYVTEGVQQLLQTDQFKQIWDTANRKTHDIAVSLLRGETVRGVTVTDGKVVLNLLPLLARAMTVISEKAPRLFGDRPIPTIDENTPIDQARQELATALGRDLPADFGVFTLFQSDQLASAQQMVTLFDRLVYLLVGLTLILFVATLVLSRNRRRTIVVLGLGIALAMIVANAIVSALQDQVVGLVSGEAARSAAATAIASLVDSLSSSTTILAWLGLIVVVAAFLAGDGRTATGVRRAVGAGAQRARQGGASVIARDGGSTGASGIPFVAHNLSAFRVGGVIATMLWLIIIDITWVKLALVLVVFVAYQAIVTVLGRSTAAGPTDAAT